MKTVRWKKIFMLTVIIFAVSGMAGLIMSADKKFKFIGSAACAKCHATDAIGNQTNIWKASPHSKAFVILDTPKGVEIAKTAGVEKPLDDYKCLKCHTTGGGRFPEIPKEGVGCESCHGPGSEYFEFENHAAFDNRKTAYAKAVSLGMYPIIGIDGIKVRERLCNVCHNEERPCLPKDLEERKKKRLGLEAVSDFIFKHSVKK